MSHGRSSVKSAITKGLDNFTLSGEMEADISTSVREDLLQSYLGSCFYCWSLVKTMDF